MLHGNELAGLPAGLFADGVGGAAGRGDAEGQRRRPAQGVDAGDGGDIAYKQALDIGQAVQQGARDGKTAQLQAGQLVQPLYVPLRRLFRADRIGRQGQGAGSIVFP